MEEEYRWLASQVQGTDDIFLPSDSIEGHYDTSSPSVNTTHDYKNEKGTKNNLDDLYYDYFVQNSSQKYENEGLDSDQQEEKEFYDVDLMRSSMENQDLPSEHFDGAITRSAMSSVSNSHMEVAIIEISNSEDDNKDEQEEQLSILRIGDRVYSVTTSLVLYLQNFILSGSRFLLRSYFNIEIPRQTQEKLHEISELSMRTLNQLSTLKALGECLTESCYFAVDRTRAYTQWYATDLISDDPEFAHKKSLRQHVRLSDHTALKKRVRFSSLSWAHRQLVRCTKDSLDDRVSSQTLDVSRPSVFNPESVKSSVSHPSDFKRHPSTKLILDRFSLIDALIAAYEANNKEAEDILLDMISPPPFEEKMSCHSCERIFSITLFRHHCRHCGNHI